MVDSKKAYADYLLKEKNYSHLTLRAYMDDLSSFECFIKYFLIIKANTYIYSFKMLREITSFCISVVPSPIVQSLESL